MAEPSMPQEVIGWIRQRDWGMHHLQWHLERIWELVDPQTRQWAEEQGWARAATQEGERGNGLAFLAMHRVMIRQLLGDFPEHAALFAGWATPPTDPDDANDPVPDNGTAREFSPDMLRAITRLHQDPGGFANDDEAGLYLETSLRPVPGDPGRRAEDRSAGIHNYLHNRFMDENSPINMGDPTVNIENERFWRLHGWIDARWAAFREAQGLGDDAPDYRQALADAEHHMGHPPHHDHVFLDDAGAIEDAAPARRVPAAVRTNVLEVLASRAAP